MHFQKQGTAKKAEHGTSTCPLMHIRLRLPTHIHALNFKALIVITVQNRLLALYVNPMDPFLIATHLASTK